MLKRSPKSRVTTLFIAAISMIVIYLAIDSLTTLQSLANNHGSRKTYYVLAENQLNGSEISSPDLKPHKMFSNDAPKNAFSGSNKPSGKFSKYDLVKGTVLTKAMVTNKAASTIDSENRIVFVPSKEILDENISNRTDLLSVSPDGYGAETIASEARILFDLTPVDLENSQNPNPGYFVEVTQFEASEIAFALSTGDVRFALINSND